MKKLPGKRFGVLLMVSLVIILAMGFYYFHIQNVKEAMVKRQAFKTLYRYAGDLKEKEGEIVEAYRNSNYKIEEDNERLKNRLNNLEDKYYTLERESHELNDDYYKKDSANYEIKENLILKNKLDSIRSLQEKIVIKYKRLNESYTSKYKSFLEMDSIRNLSNNVNSDDYLYYPIKQADVENNIKFSNKKKQFKVSKVKIFPDVLEKEFFSGFIAFNSTEVIYNQFKNTHIELKRKKGKQSINLDTLMHLFKSKNKLELSLEGGSSDFDIKNPYELQMPISLKGLDYQLFVVKVEGYEVEYLAGLMPLAKYTSLKRGFDRGLVSAITVFVLLLLLSIPIVKLFVVAPGEAYTIRSLITLVISSVGVVFIIAYFVLHQGSLAYIKKHVKEDGEHLHAISNSIKRAFSTELDLMKRQLLSMNSCLKKTQNDSVYTSDLVLKSQLKLIPNLLKDSLFWMDAFIVQGKEGQYSCNNKKTPQKPEKYGYSLAIIHNCNRYNDRGSNSGIPLLKRDYMKNPNRFTWDTSNYSLSYGLESIFSLTTAKPQVVISSRIDSTSYIACIGQEMTSVSNTILPYGYSFCIIDPDGKVWFHKDAKNNIRENLFVETDDNPNLRAAVASHRKDEFMADYKMKPVMMRVAPMESDLGLFIVTMCEVNNYTQLVNQTGYIIIAAYILILLFWLLVSWIYRVCSNRFAGINNPPHVLAFFFPIGKETSKYISLFIVNFLMILFWVVAILMLAKHIYVIHWISLLALIGASTITWHIRLFYLKDEKTLSYLTLIRRIGFSIIAFGLIELMLSYTCYVSFSFLISTSLIIIFNCLFYVFKKTEANWLSGFKKSLLNTFGSVVKSWNTIENKYYLYIFSLLVLFVFVPLSVLYTTTFQQESSLHYMAQQRYVADQILKRRLAFTEQHNRKEVISLLDARGNYYEQFHEMQYIDSFKLSVAYCEVCKEKHKQSLELDSCMLSTNPLMSTTNYVRIFGQARANMFYINNVIEDRGNRVKPNYINSDDQDKRFTYFISVDSLFLSVKKGGVPYNKQAFYLKMEKPSLYEVPMRYMGILYGFLLIIVLYILVMPRLGRYLFPQFKYTKDIFTGAQSKNQLHQLIPGENKYIVTMPDKAFYEKCIKADNTKMYRLHLPDSMLSFLSDNNVNKHVYLFIDHISFKGVNQLTAFVEHLEKVMEGGHYLSFNIVCFKVPKILIRHFRDSLISDLRKNNKKTAKKQMQLETTLKRLINCLAYFSMTYVPILEQPLKGSVLKELKSLKGKWKDDYLKSNSTNNKSVDIDEQWNKHLGWIEGEIGKNAALIDKYKLFSRQETLSNNKEITVVNEDNVYQAYLINRTYYQKIWDSCSKEEKSILYDIAEDYVINLHKNGVVNILINKGLIKNGQFLQLFNLSFSLFVMRQEEEVDVINANLREHSKSGWKQYSLPLKLMGVAIVVFLIVTQQEFLTGMQSILISIGAILTFAVRFFNFPLRSGN